MISHLKSGGLVAITLSQFASKFGKVELKQGKSRDA